MERSCAKRLTKVHFPVENGAGMPGLLLEEVKHDFDTPYGFEETYERSFIAPKSFNTQRCGFVAALDAISAAQTAYFRSIYPQELSHSGITQIPDLDDYAWTDVSLTDGYTA